MNELYVFSDYIHHAMNRAKYTRLEDNSVAGVIPECQGLAAFGKTIKDCRQELQATLEAWILVGLKLGHTMPIIHGINLNKEPLYEQSYRV